MQHRRPGGQSPRGYRPPPGLAIAGNVADWRGRAETDITSDSRLRADGRSTRLALVAVLASLTHRHTGDITAGHTQLAAMVSQRLGRRVARSTIGNHTRALQEDGWIGVAAHGCSAAIAGRNMAHVYVLLQPVDPQWSAQDEAALARLKRSLETAGQPVDGHPPVTVYGVSLESREIYLNRFADDFSRPETRAERPERFAPRTHRERTAAVRWLIDDLGWSSNERTFAELGRLCWPFFAAGWCAAAVRAAIDRPPAGGQVHAALPGTRERDRARPLAVRSRFAVLNWRLGLWLGGRWSATGTPCADAPLVADRPGRGRPPTASTSATLPARWVRSPTPPPSRVLDLLAAGGFRSRHSTA